MPDLYTPPMPPDEADRARVEHSRLRRRLLTGNWRQDLREFMSREIDAIRLKSWGEGDVTRNAFRSVVNQLAVLYDRKPIISNDAPGAEELADVLDRAGLWQYARRLLVMTIGMREALYRIAVVDVDGEPSLQIRIVPSDLVYGDSNPDEPDVPTMITEYRLRQTGRGDNGWEWTKDVLDIRGPEPIYRVLSADGKEDLSGAFLGVDGGLVGEAYPYRLEGRPCLPYVLYHAERNSDGLFDPYEGSELVEGSLVASTLWTYWRHVVRDCSHPQRWCVGVRPAGGMVTDRDQNMAYIPTDPASLINFEPTSDLTPSLGQFQPGGDPGALGEAIRAYVADMSLDFGISSTDMARVSANPRSGYAIALSREGVRAAQRRSESQSRRGDLETLSKVAAFWNAATGSNLPESGWRIAYPGMPLSIDEKKAMIEEWQALAELGVASVVDLYMGVHNVSREAAITALERIALERSRYTFTP